VACALCVLQVETYGYTRGNYMRGCFPYHVSSLPKPAATGKAAGNGKATANGKAAGQVSVFGVAYGRACSRECHEELHLIPSPKQRCRREGA
jgi:hypothetical protein